MTREQIRAICVTDATFEEIDALIAMARRTLELEEALEWFAKQGNALDSSGYGLDDKWWECIYNDGKRAGGSTPMEAIRNAMEALCASK